MAFPRIKRVSCTQSEDALCLTLKGATAAKKAKVAIRERWAFATLLTCQGLTLGLCA
jgi:hypothetical protein